MSNNLTNYLDQYRDQRYECLTITLYSNILWKDRSVLCLFYGHSLVDEKIDFLLKFYCENQVTKQQNGLNKILEILKELVQLPELPRVIDIGLLKDSLEEIKSLNRETIVAKLWYMHLNNCSEPKDVVLFGFGRIGRLLARELCTDPALQIQLNLKAVVTRDPININYLRKRASLLQKDSIHGAFKGRVDIDEYSNSLIINGKQVQIISAQNAEEINYSSYGIQDAILIDNTGKYRDYSCLSKHLRNESISRVIVTAPANDIPNIVYGVNHQKVYNSDSKIFSTASCTTNAITPILDILDSEFGIEKGHIETIHAYTNDQNLVDNMHSKSRRGRAAALNMVITETGAGNAVSKIIPNLKGKLSSNAIRVPIASGSLAILMLNLKKKTNLESVHQKLMERSSTPTKHKQIDLLFEEELVSSDIIGHISAGVVDGCASRISADGQSLTLYVWYDNEYGYSMQVLGYASWLSNELQQQQDNSKKVIKANASNLLTIDILN